MPLLVLQLASDNTQDRVFTTSAEKQCCQNAQFTGSQTACLDMLSCSLHSNHMQTLFVFAFKSGLWPTLMPSVTYPNTIKVSALVFTDVKGFWGGCVCFIFRWRLLRVVAKRAFPLALALGVCHHSQASALSLSFLSILVVVACGPSSSSALARVIQHGGEKFSRRSSVLLLVTLLKWFFRNDAY